MGQRISVAETPATPDRRQAQSPPPLSPSPHDADSVPVSLNPLSRVLLLREHSDIVRFCLRLDDRFFCTGGDDGKIVVWDSRIGGVARRLEGHTRPITCLSLVEPASLVSGSSDKTMRKWNWRTGECVTAVDVSGTLRIVIPLSLGRFVAAAGNDRRMDVFNADLSVDVTFLRHEDANLNCMILLKRDLLVTGSNSAVLLVYNLHPPSFDRALSGSHRESIRCLEIISDAVFASGSDDGCIVIWDSDRLSPMRTIRMSNVFSTVLSSSVIVTLRALESRFLCVGLDRGFAVVKWSDGSLVLDGHHLHNASVTCMTLAWGSFVVSASVDGCIRFWGPGVPPLASPDIEVGHIASSTLSQYQQVGECWAHMDAVNDLILLPEGLVSVGADGLTILWRDSRVAIERENVAGALYLKEELKL